MRIWKSERINTPVEVGYDHIAEFTPDNGTTLNDNIYGPVITREKTLQLGSRMVSIMGDPRLLVLCTDDLTGSVTDYSGNGHVGSSAWMSSSYQHYKGLGYTYDYSNYSQSYIRFPNSMDFCFGDGSNDSDFSLGCFFHHKTEGDNQVLMSKINNSVVMQSDWLFSIRDTEALSFLLVDTSTSSYPSVYSSVLTGGWHFGVVTYSGTGLGSLAASRVSMYVDGELDNATVTNAPAYVAMEGSTTDVTVGLRQHSSSRIHSFQSSIGLSFICGTEWTAKQVQESWLAIKSTYGI